MEIIPNWHPIFVHFSVALLMTAALLHIAAFVVKKDALKLQLTYVARWNLWIGTTISVFTVVAGWAAFNSVNHDEVSHLAMLEHRKWAVITFVVFVVICAWSLLMAKKSAPISVLEVMVLLVASGLLASTAWHGGELVYRHGLGVMSLPKAGDHGHDDHGHAEQKHSHSGTDNHHENHDELKSVVPNNLPMQDDHHEQLPKDVDDMSGPQNSTKENKQTPESHVHDHSDHEH